MHIHNPLVALAVAQVEFCPLRGKSEYYKNIEVFLKLEAEKKNDPHSMVRVIETYSKDSLKSDTDDMCLVTYFDTDENRYYITALGQLVLDDRYEKTVERYKDAAIKAGFLLLSDVKNEQ